MLQEREKVEGSLNALVEQGVRVSKGLFQENLQATQEWLNKALIDSNRTFKILLSFGRKYFRITR